MRGVLATLTECEANNGHRYMTGRLGGMSLRLHPSGTTDDGRQQWELTILTPSGPKTDEAKHNVKGWKRRQREREGVTITGGQD